MLGDHNLSEQDFIDARGYLPAGHRTNMADAKWTGEETSKFFMLTAASLCDSGRFGAREARLDEAFISKTMALYNVRPF